MSFQGKEFTAEMKRLVVNLKEFFDKERKAQRELSRDNIPRAEKKIWGTVTGQTHLDCNKIRLF